VSPCHLPWDPEASHEDEQPRRDDNPLGFV
jgi:hypothetical protein